MNTRKIVIGTVLVIVGLPVVLILIVVVSVASARFPCVSGPAARSISAIR